MFFLYLLAFLTILLFQVLRQELIDFLIIFDYIFFISESLSFLFLENIPHWNLVAFKFSYKLVCISYRAVFILTPLEE
ncbi:Uncharacterised protein [Mycobacterium tuberculosis]|nr:Uncharacterised protein [Mycobacterium tuberculosis]